MKCKKSETDLISKMTVHIYNCAKFSSLVFYDECYASTEWVSAKPWRCQGEVRHFGYTTVNMLQKEEHISNPEP